MKKCPYCAEEIQNDAIKCKHCGEWFSKPTETSKETPEKPDEPLDLSSSMDVEIELNDSTETVGSEDNVDIVIDSPLQQKSKWGWGWFLLLAFIALGLQKMGGVSETAQAMSYLFSIILPVLLLAVYFWIRRRIIKENKYATQVWTFSLTAGFQTYILAIIAIGFAMYFVSAQDRKDNNLFFSNFQGAAEVIRAKEIKLSEQMSVAPETDKEISESIIALKEYLQLISSKRTFSEELFRYFENYGKSKKDNQVINDVARIREVNSELWEKSVASINNQISYYSTGDERFYNNYERLTTEIASIESEYRELSKKIIDKIKF